MSPDTRIVYLVRHGQTALNARRALRGWLDPPLDLTGERQAGTLAESLRSLDPVAIFSSPLWRARQTASAIAAQHGMMVSLDRGLVDRDYGRWAGTSMEEVRRHFDSIDDAPGVEAWSSLCDRTTKAIRSIDESSELGPLVVVAHDAVNRAVLSTLVPSLRPEALIQPTGCWNRLERQGRRWTASALGQVPG